MTAPSVATLFSNFSSSFDPMTGLITFTANSHFELMAGTGYWLVLSDPSTGGVSWEFTASNFYHSQFGYQLPSHNTSWTSTEDNGSGTSSMYYQPSDGPQLFDLIAPTPASVPEPHTFILLCFPVAMAILTLWFQGRPVRLAGPPPLNSRGCRWTGDVRIQSVEDTASRKQIIFPPERIPPALWSLQRDQVEGSCRSRDPRLTSRFQAWRAERAL